MKWFNNAQNSVENQIVNFAKPDTVDEAVDRVQSTIDALDDLIAGAEGNVAAASNAIESEMQRHANELTRLQNAKAQAEAQNSAAVALRNDLTGVVKNYPAA